MQQPRFFDSAAQFRAWLEKHHASETELLVGFRKRATGLPSPTYHEALDEALCFGWIDGVRRSMGEEAYSIRFTPRKPGSLWSRVNLKRAAALKAAGRMRAAGLKELEGAHERPTHYAYDQTVVEFTAEQRKRFKANKAAWAFFEKQPPSYVKPCTWWVISAKKPETQDKRLDRLIAESAAGRRLL